MFQHMTNKELAIHYVWLYGEAEAIETHEAWVQVLEARKELERRGAYHEVELITGRPSTTRGNRK